MGKALRKFKEVLKKAIYITFKEESIEGYIAFFIFAIIFFKFILPFFSKIFLKTEMPIFVVVTESMEHSDKEKIKYTFYDFFIKRGIDPEKLPFKNGINRGDIVIVVGKNPRDIKVGDVVIFIPRGGKMPLLHRVIEKKCNEKCYFTMKGDANAISINISYQGKIFSEVNVPEENIKGVAVFRIPYLGYPKVILVDLFYLIFFGSKPFPW